MHGFGIQANYSNVVKANNSRSSQNTSESNFSAYVAKLLAGRDNTIFAVPGSEEKAQLEFLKKEEKVPSKLEKFPTIYDDLSEIEKMIFELQKEGKE